MTRAELWDAIETLVCDYDWDANASRYELIDSILEAVDTYTLQNVVQVIA